MDTELLLRLQRKIRAEMKADNLRYHGLPASPDFLFDNFDLHEKEIAMLTHEIEANHLGTHSHPFFEIVYVCSGSCIQTFGGRQIRLERGSVCIMNPRAEHALSIESVTDIVLNIIIDPAVFNAAFLSFMCQDELLSNFFLSYLYSLPSENSCLLFQSPYNPTVDRLVEQMLREYLDGDAYSRVNLRCFLILMLSELLRSKAAEKQNLNTEKINDILKYITDHLADATLIETAAAFYMHPNYLSAYIKKHTGRSFAEIHATLRVTYAQNLLINSAMPIDEIGELLGYKSSVSFYNMFKRQTGMTPAVFRKLNRDVRFQNSLATQIAP